MVPVSGLEVGIIEGDERGGDEPETASHVIKLLVRLRNKNGCQNYFHMRSVLSGSRRKAENISGLPDCNP